MKPVGPVTLTFGGKVIGTVKNLTVHEPCECESNSLYTVTIGPYYATDAARQIAALRPLRFPRNRANQLGNKCVAALGLANGCLRGNEG